VGRVTLRTAGALAALGAAIGLAAPGPAAALLVWSLTGSPLTATAGQTTTFTLTATNADLLAELGCVEVALPTSFASVTAGTASASNGDAWEVRVLSGPVVEARSLGGGGRLETLDTVTFTFGARPTTAGATTWPTHAHRRHDCSDADEIGVPLAVTIVPPVLPAPTPAPTPPPTPGASATLLPSLPLPTLALPSSAAPLPSFSVTTPAPSPTGPAVLGPTATPPASTGGGPSTAPPASRSVAASASASPTASATPSSSGLGQPAAPPTRGLSGAAPEAAAPRLGFQPASVDVELDEMGLLAGAAVWAVPAATLAVPGILLVLFVTLQAAGALAWIPAVRRLSGGDQQP